VDAECKHQDVESDFSPAFQKRRIPLKALRGVTQNESDAVFLQFFLYLRGAGLVENAGEHAGRTVANRDAFHAAA
jgi:hypothetical protein